MGAGIPDVYADGLWTPSETLDTAARAWRTAVLEGVGDRQQAIAAVMPTTPDGVAVFAALSSLPSPLALLGPDAASWPRAPGRPAPLPPGTPIILLPSLRHLAPSVQRYGCVPWILPEAGRRTGAPAVAPFSGPGVVMFTSGSTGNPKAVFRPFAALLAANAARADALGLKIGEGLIVGATLVHGHGLNTLLTAMLLGGPLALLSPLDYRAALATLAMPQFACWRATPHFADLLGRCALDGPAVAPRVCMVSAPIGQAVFDAFRDRFGTPLRQGYSSSETGAVSVDSRPAAAVAPGTVGRPLRDVQLHIGERPDAPAPAGEAGLIWIRSPYLMGGYGFPPHVSRPGEVEGWWPTRDRGRVRADGELTLTGRVDECIRTRDGRLVDLAAVSAMLRHVRGVRQVAVLPLPGASGPSFGAVIECSPSLPMPRLRVAMTDALPAWARPRKLVVVPVLPRLPNGKPDREACLAALGAGGTRQQRYAEGVRR
jgi:long-chain acyl-CoA synthetase